MRCLTHNVCLLPPGVTTGPGVHNAKDDRVKWLQTWVLPAHDLVCWQEVFDAPWVRLGSRRIAELESAAAASGFHVVTSWRVPWWSPPGSTTAATRWWERAWATVMPALWRGLWAAADWVDRIRTREESAGPPVSRAWNTRGSQAWFARSLWTAVDAGLVTLFRGPVRGRLFCPYPGPEHWSGDRLATKGALYTLLDRGRAGGLVHVFNTHLHSDQLFWSRGPGSGARERARQLDVLVAFIRHVTAADTFPVYVCGDLNLDPATAEYTSALCVLGAVDRVRDAGFRVGPTVTLGAGTGEQMLTCDDDRAVNQWLDHLWQVDPLGRPDRAGCDPVYLWGGARTAQARDTWGPGKVPLPPTAPPTPPTLEWTHVSDHRGWQWHWTATTS